MQTVYSLPYGKGLVPVEIPAESVVGTLRARPLPEDVDEDEVVRRALADPIASPRLGELVNRDDEVCIIIGDATRSWVRSHVLLPHILEELTSAGVEDDNVLIVCATGDHRSHTEEEHVQLVGEEVFLRVRVVDHDARSDDDLVYMGHTTRGTPVNINTQVASADRVIITGGIVYHFLAGFGGGGKAILPGVAGYESIMTNHSLALAEEEGRGLNPEVMAGKTDGNPIYEDIVAGASMIAPTFMVNAIVDEDDHRISMAVAGAMEPAHRIGCRLVEKHFSVTVDEPAELVVASAGGYPKDINFYQTYKTIYNARHAVADGGTLLIVSECSEGMGNDDFASVLTDLEDNCEREAAVRERFTIGGFMGFHEALMAEECDVIVISELEDSEVSAGGMIPAVSSDEAAEFIRRKHGGWPSTYVMPYGTVLPVIEA